MGAVPVIAAALGTAMLTSAGVAISSAPVHSSRVAVAPPAAALAVPARTRKPHTVGIEATPIRPHHTARARHTQPAQPHPSAITRAPRPRPTSAPLRQLRAARLRIVQHSTELNVDTGEILVLGQAVNDAETTFDHAVVRVDLYDEQGVLLNARVPGEVPQTAGDQIRPGDVLPFKWEQAAPRDYASAVVTVTGVEPVSAVRIPSVKLGIESRRDAGTGSSTIVRGWAVNDSDSEIGLLVDVTAYDAGRRLLDLASATFDGDYMIVLEPGARVRWSARLDCSIEDVATIHADADVPVNH